MAPSLPLDRPASRFLTILAIVWLIRGLDRIDSFYSWLKHGLPTGAITYATTIRFGFTIVGVATLVAQHQRQKRQSAIGRSL